MNGRNDNENPAGGAASSAQGIFSTPELTVDTEKIAPNPQSRDQSRVAAFFANTEASQRAQNPNNSPAANGNIIPATATEDIVIDNGKQKNKKIPLIIAAVVAAVLVIAGIATAFVIDNSNKSAVFASFNDYLTYLENGPADNSIEGLDSLPTYYLFVVDDLALNNTAKQEYIDDLINKYQIFSDQLTETNLDINGVSHDVIIERTRSNFVVLKAVSNVLLIDTLQDQLLNTYVTSGKNAAYNFIQEQFAIDSDIEIVSSLVGYLQQYFSVELSLLDIYYNYGCINGVSISATCRIELTKINNTFNELIAQQEQLLYLIQAYYTQVQYTFQGSTERLTNIFGSNHA